MAGGTSHRPAAGTFDLVNAVRMSDFQERLARFGFDLAPRAGREMENDFRHHATELSGASADRRGARSVPRRHHAAGTPEHDEHHARAESEHAVLLEPAE